MDAYRSQDTVIYRPIGDDAPEAVALCSYGDVMVSLVDVAPSVQVQREAVIGSRWMHQAARGNAGLQMSFPWRGLSALTPPSGHGDWT